MFCLRTFVEGLRTFHMHTLRTVCSDVGLRRTTFYRIFFDAYTNAIYRHLAHESEMHRVHRHLTHSFSPPPADDAAGCCHWPSLGQSPARFRLRNAWWQDDLYQRSCELHCTTKHTYAYHVSLSPIYRLTLTTLIRN